LFVAFLGVTACASNGSSGAKGAETNFDKDSKELPPEVASMLERKECRPRMRGAMDLHQRTVKGDDGKVERAFLIQPDEQLCLVGRATGNAFTDLRIATELVSPEQAKKQLIAVELQMSDIGAVLAIRNHHDRPLRYRAVMSLSATQARPTTVCPVMAGLVSLEHWPHPVQLLMFGDFRLLEPQEPMDCR